MFEARFGVLIFSILLLIYIFFFIFAEAITKRGFRIAARILLSILLIKAFMFLMEFLLHLMAYSLPIQK